MYVTHGRYVLKSKSNFLEIKIISYLKNTVDGINRVDIVEGKIIEDIAKDKMKHMKRLKRYI